MSRRPALRLLSALAATALAAGLLATSVPPASAAPNQYAPSIGRLTASPVTGSTAIGPTIWTTAPCPAGTAGINVFVDSPAAGLFEAVAVGSDNASVPGMMRAGVPFGFNLVDVAAGQGRTLVNGRYEVSLVCVPDFFGSPATGQFDGTFVVTGGATTAAQGTTYTFASPQPTGVVFDGLESVTQTNGPVSLTVLTTPPGAAGTVQVQELVNGSPVDLGPAQRATQQNTVAVDLASGDHTLRAVFTPDDPAAFTPATSAPVTTTVTASPTATETTTTLTVTPGGTLFGPLDVDAAVAVSPAASGTVEVLDGAAVVTSGRVDRGVALLGFTASVGVHAYTAAFTPDRPDLFTGSTSAPVAVDVRPFLPTAITAKVKPRSGDCGKDGCTPSLDLRADVSPSAATGSVIFFEYSTVVTRLADVPVVDGRVRTTVPTTPGTHRIQAVFVPTRGSAYAGSSTPELTVVVPARRDR